MLLGFILGFKMQKRSFITLLVGIDKTIFHISVYGVDRVTVTQGDQFYPNMKLLLLCLLVQGPKARPNSIDAI